jgi:hypothetical protein
MTANRTIRIAQLNDILRTTFLQPFGRVMLTAGIRASGADFESACVKAVQTFDDFPKGNDPYGEHDFGALDVRGKRVFWKIDYYDKALEYGSDDPANPAQTTRVLTIMLASEY